MIVPLLPEMRAEITARFDKVDARFDSVDRRLKALKSAQGSFRLALTADSLLSKLVTGEFEQGIESLEQKVRELEAQK